MDRQAEVEILAATLEDPARAMIRAAIAVQRKGRLDEAAKIVAGEVKRRRSLSWVALLLALEAAELRMAGSVTYATPRARFVASGSPVFEERWDPFCAIVWPAEHYVTLEIVPADYDIDLELQAKPIGPATWREVDDAVRVLSGELGRYLGLRIPHAWLDA